MKILGISSGLSYNGYTANLIRVALQSAANQGALVEEIFLPDYEIKICKGCRNCLAKGKCSINDDLELLRQKIYQADGIIIGTQAFGSEPDPTLQNFINRIKFYAQHASSFSDKYLLTVATTETFGAQKASKMMTGLVSGYLKNGIVSSVLSFNVSWEQIEHYPEYLGQIENQTIKLVNDIKRRRRFRVNDLFERLINRFIRVPQVKKMVEAHKYDKMEAVYRELSAKGLLNAQAPETTQTSINVTATAQS